MQRSYWPGKPQLHVKFLHFLKTDKVLSSKFFWKLFTAYGTLFVASITLIVCFVFSHIKGSLVRDIRLSMQDKLTFLEPFSAQYLSKNDQPKFQELLEELGLKTHTRITLMSPEGHVVADSHTTATESRRNDPEIQEAFSNPFGFAQRYSEDNAQKMFYMARVVRSASGSTLGIISVSVPLSIVLYQLIDIEKVVLYVTGMSIFLALIVGFYLSRRVTIPITEMMAVCTDLQEGKYHRQVKFLPDDEIGGLGRTLNQLGKEITQKLETIYSERTQLRKLENIRRDFVANVSHELKTPLTSIKGYAETLLNGALEDQKVNKRFVEKILHSADRLYLLVLDILNLAKIEDDEHLHLALEATPWDSLIRRSLLSFEDQLKRKELRLAFTIEEEGLLPLGEREAMQQIIDNLLSNAIRYTPAHGQITIRVYKDEGHVCLDVKDTGIGIPDKDLKRVFERFYRVDKDRSRQLGGTGLGLSIVKHLVQNMKGVITVASNVGEGTLFRVSLPSAPTCQILT